MHAFDVSFNSMELAWSTVVVDESVFAMSDSITHYNH